jgi:hypothetical protein
MFLADAAKIEAQLEADHSFPTEKRNDNKGEVLISHSKQKPVI